MRIAASIREKVFSKMFGFRENKTHFRPLILICRKATKPENFRFVCEKNAFLPSYILRERSHEHTGQMTDFFLLYW